MPSVSRGAFANTLEDVEEIRNRPGYQWLRSDSIATPRSAFGRNGGNDPHCEQRLLGLCATASVPPPLLKDLYENMGRSREAGIEHAFFSSAVTY
jgi:hypothetical protein